MNTFLTIVITSFVTWYITSFFYQNFKTKTVVTTTNDGIVTKNISMSNNYCNNNNLNINNINGNIVTINGKTYHGDIIASKDGGVYVDGKTVDVPNDFIYNINIKGDVGSVSVSIGDVTITGNVNEYVKTSQGTIKVNNGNVIGDAKTGQGDITIYGSLHGSAKTGMGNINVK